MASSTSSTATTGSYIVLAGLLVQIIIFSFFIAVAVVFHRRMKTSELKNTTPNLLPWQRTLLLLYVTSALVLVRNIVRVAEFIEGFNGFIILHEVFLYVFDAVPMLAVSFAFNIWYPSEFRDRGRAERKTDGLGVEMGAEVKSFSAEDLR